MQTAFKIALRYLFSKKSTNAINVISYISMIGMGLGALVLVVLLSVFNGFEEVVSTLQSSFYADVELEKVQGKVFELESAQYEQLSKIEGVAAMALVLEENAYVSYDGKSSVATVRAYDDNFEEVNDIKDYMIKGEAVLHEDGNEFALLGAGVYY
jgi:lipoprotein-releasing system permease protein